MLMQKNVVIIIRRKCGIIIILVWERFSHPTHCIRARKMLRLDEMIEMNWI